MNLLIQFICIISGLASEVTASAEIGSTKTVVSSGTETLGTGTTVEGSAQSTLSSNIETVSAETSSGKL